MSSHTFKVGTCLVHTRYQTGRRDGSRFVFDFAEAALEADYELWVCGSTGAYFLIPHEVIARWYSNPATYRRGKYCIVAPNITTNRAEVARGGVTMDISAFRDAEIV